MTGDPELQAIAEMLAEPRRLTVCQVGGEKVVAGHGDLRSVMAQIDSALKQYAQGGPACRLALMADDQDERSMIAAAVVARAKELGISTIFPRGAWGQWAQQARSTDALVCSLHVLADIPPEAQAVRGFKVITKGLILVWPLNMAGSAHMPEGVGEIVLRPFAERPLDKIAHIVSAAIEALDAEPEAQSRDQLENLLRGISQETLFTKCLDAGSFVLVSSAREAGRRLADAILSRAALRPGELLTVADLNHALSPQLQRLPSNIRRLWVEGETDAALLKLAARLMRTVWPEGPGGLDGIEIEILGGAAQVDAAIQRCDRPPGLELFMFDSDREGLRGHNKVKELKFPTLQLESEARMSACDSEWVVEDLLSVPCLDRFYIANPNLKPKREEIAYHPIEGRRLVVRGEDKGTLVSWLEENATVDDVLGVVRQLLAVRRTFALREPAVDPDRPVVAPVGMRPQPWWYVPTGP